MISHGDTDIIPILEYKTDLRRSFRLAWDLNTGHQLKIVYDLEGVNIISDSIDAQRQGYLYRNSYDNSKLDEPMSYEEYIDYIRKNIHEEGSTYFYADKQKVISIIDMVNLTLHRNKLKSGRIVLKEANIISPFWLSKYNATRYKDLSLHPELFARIQKAALEYDNKAKRYNLKPCITTVRKNEIESIPSFKTTKWPPFKTTPDNFDNDKMWEKIVANEYHLKSRGIKGNDIDPTLFITDMKVDGITKTSVHENPSRKEAIEELTWILNRYSKLYEHLKNDQSPKAIAARLEYDKIIKALNEDLEILRKQKNINPKDIVTPYRNLERDLMMYEFNKTSPIEVSRYICENTYNELKSMGPEWTYVLEDNDRIMYI